MATEGIRDSGDWLIKNNRQDSALKETVNEKHDKNQDSYDNFATKVAIRYTRLQKALLKSQEFQATFSDFNSTVEDLKKRLEDGEPLTARFEPLKRIQEEHEVQIYIYIFLFYLVVEDIIYSVRGSGILTFFSFYSNVSSMTVCFGFLIMNTSPNTTYLSS